MTKRRVLRMVSIAGIVVVALGICGYLVIAPPRSIPAYDGVLPVAPAEDGYARHTETAVVDLPLADYLRWSDRVPLDTILGGDDSVPKVVRTDMIMGTWGDPGARRRVVLEDGHYAAEQILVNDRTPDRSVFRYQVFGYTNYAKLAADLAIGEFVMTSTGPGGRQTQVTWTYVYHHRIPVTAGFLDGFVADVWAPYMHTVLQGMKNAAENP